MKNSAVNITLGHIRCLSLFAWSRFETPQPLAGSHTPKIFVAFGDDRFWSRVPYFFRRLRLPQVATCDTARPKAIRGGVATCDRQIPKSLLGGVETDVTTSHFDGFPYISLRNRVLAFFLPFPKTVILRNGEIAEKNDLKRYAGLFMVKIGPLRLRIRPWGDFDLQNSMFNTKWTHIHKNNEKIF